MRVLGVLLLSLLIISVGSAGVLIDRIVAVVDDEPITWSELYRRTAFELSDRIADLTPEQRKKIIEDNEPEVLQRMIDELIITTEARKEGVMVDDKEVENTIREIAKRNNLTEEDFAKVLRQRDMTLKFYRDILRQQILVQRYETLKLKDRISVSDEEIEGYLKEKGIKKDEKESVVLRQIYIPYSEDSEGIVSEVLDALSRGMPFEEAARRYSRGPLAGSGGYLGQVRVDELSKPLREALKGLKEGQYSGPVRTTTGIIILYLENKLPSYDAYKRQAREELFIQKLQRLEKIWLSKLRKEHWIEIRL